MRTAHVYTGAPARVGPIIVQRMLPTPGLPQIDPFLFLDFFRAELTPGATPPGNAHPHRGFETVTFVLAGEMGYRDSLGNKGVLATDSIEWMTAGSGIVHDGHHDHDFARRGGRITGIQLWVNLPARLKMTPPDARYLPPETFPETDIPGGRVRVLAGSAHGCTSPVEVKVPVRFLDYVLEPDASVTVPVPAGWNAFAQVCEGRLANTPEGALVHFTGDGDIVLTASETGVRAIVGLGQPIGEPVASGGPFVMNTREELIQAFADYRAGRMGWLPN